jgi:hypothetical protein
VAGQDQIEKKITENFLKYCVSVPREEIYMHSDRNLYIAGENLWFDIYLFDRKSNKLSDGSKLAYVEVLNSTNQPVLQKRIRLEKGNGPGLISLPDTMSTGRYILRAYTNWMKNFLPGNCFMKELIICNAISDRTLIGKSFNGEMRKDGKDTGYSLDINKLSNYLAISILYNQKSLIPDKSIYYVFIQTRGNINFMRSFKPDQGKSIMEIENKFLMPGVNEITLFNSEGEPLVSENIFTPNKDDNIPVLICKDNFGQRQKIILEIDQPGTTSSETENFSISVSPVTDFPEQGINDYMVFGSEFGVIPDRIRNHKLSELSPEIINEFVSGLKSKWIDWERIMSGNFEPVYPMETEDHYLSGRLVNNDAAIDSSKNLFLSIPGKNAVFNYARTDKNGKFSFCIPVDEEYRDIIIQPENSTGNSVIKVESSYAEQYFPLSGIIDTSGINIPDIDTHLSVNYQIAEIYKSGCSGNPLEKAKKLKTTGSFYGKPDLEVILADYLALPDMEEVFFELVPGVLLKNKKSVYNMSVADGADGRIFDKPPIMLIDGVVISDPAVIAALDPDNIEKIDAVKDMYMVGDYMFFGIVNIITKAGDFSSITLPGYAVRLKYRVTEPVSSFCSPDYSTEASKKSRIPDFRNTLYWNPSVKPDSNGKASVEFWSSDYAGDYEINVQGNDSEGKPVSVRKVIKILPGKR